MTTIREIFRAQPLAELPPWLADLLAHKTNAAPQGQTPAVELDEPSNIAWTIHYLTHDAPPSIEGRGGEATTLQVAAVLKDRGISEFKCVELMNEFYNIMPTCDPLWSMDAAPAEDLLPVKVHNAYTYLVANAPGAGTAEAEFAGEPVEPQSNYDPREDNFVVLDGMKFSVVRTPRPRYDKKKPKGGPS